MSKILAIEAAVLGGSVSVLDTDGSVVVSFGGETNVSRAEDLLLHIERLLSDNAITRPDLSLIAVSNGPGSYTGLRIGIATALGLKHALGIQCFGVSVLEAMVANTTASTMTAAVPIGNRDVAWQTFTRRNGVSSPSAPARAAAYPEFVKDLAKDSDAPLIVPTTLRNMLIEGLADTVDRRRFIDAGLNLSQHIGRAVILPEFRQPPRPVYARSSQTRNYGRV